MVNIKSINGKSTVAVIPGDSLHGVDLSGYIFDGASFNDLEFTSARLHDTVFRFCTFKTTYINSTDLSYAYFLKCKFIGTQIHACDLSFAYADDHAALQKGVQGNYGMFVNLLHETADQSFIERKEDLTDSSMFCNLIGEASAYAGGNMPKNFMQRMLTQSISLFLRDYALANSQEHVDSSDARNRCRELIGIATYISEQETLPSSAADRVTIVLAELRLAVSADTFAIPFLEIAKLANRINAILLIPINPIPQET